jgi:hypothetical protein
VNIQQDTDDDDDEVDHFLYCGSASGIKKGLDGRRDYRHTCVRTASGPGFHHNLMVSSEYQGYWFLMLIIPESWDNNTIEEQYEFQKIKIKN